jgi:hypothetical protein
MLAYYVEWYIREAWRELMFADEDTESKAHRDPFAPAQRSEATLRKTAGRVIDDGAPVHCFRTLLHELSRIVRNTCILFRCRRPPTRLNAEHSNCFKPSSCSQPRHRPRTTSNWPIAKIMDSRVETSA